VINNTLFFNKDIDYIKDNIFEYISKERDIVGYYNLPMQDISEYEKYTQNIKATNIVIIGIGGSSLGTKAIYDFLKHKINSNKTIHFLESTDPVRLSSKIKSINLKDSLFIIISKSGLTIETISIFKYVNSLIEMNSENSLIISDKDSKLWKYAKSKDIQTFEIPSNVGGRFSVLSAVSIVPLLIMGIDVNNILLGARNIYDSFFNKQDIFDKILTKALFYTHNSKEFNINCVFSYCESMDSFNRWYIQLWGESLGKKQLNSELNVSLTPIGLLGPLDQHSFLQLIIDGHNDKSLTFIKIKDFESDLKIPDVKIPYLEELDMINGVSFSKLINKQADSIIESIKKANTSTSLDILELDKIDEKSIGEIIFYYELLTSVVGKMMNINTYNQDGVENGKKILKEILHV